ncbi:hypothetical protein MPTK1_7g10620 [Marchantia polymorpha subsp. ruderalis]|uniref:Uncharacterized protein n=2 Tax=Marchantia polymorpha TaxID=3197 RepID=A0AAF6BY57_MARPO|nr:hypothetical protein MARPO_0316s0003 [Marchantia polymorpha]BBN16941.1 hypothetical protein Mp_7g10620 [Marchantia polymorpha subsp. ruderalis]|eukprot:PTQ26842.1 hypothetical protein MARPO_0316s0003 [Marchantia polymorpha]
MSLVDSFSRCGPSNFLACGLVQTQRVMRVQVYPRASFFRRVPRSLPDDPSPKVRRKLYPEDCRTIREYDRHNTNRRFERDSIG